MAVSVFPYSSSDTLDILLIQLFPAGASAATRPTAVQVAYYLRYAASLLDFSLSEVGYVLPLAAMTGEDWPDSQTYFLDYTVASGAAGIIGNAMRPAPAMGPGLSTSPGNVFFTHFNSFLTRLSRGETGLRANYRNGSKAERFLLTQRASMASDGDTDYMELADHLSFFDSAGEVEAYETYIQSQLATYKWV